MFDGDVTEGSSNIRGSRTSLTLACSGELSPTREVAVKPVLVRLIQTRLLDLYAQLGRPV